MPPAWHPIPDLCFIAVVAILVYFLGAPDRPVDRGDVLHQAVARRGEVFRQCHAPALAGHTEANSAERPSARWPACQWPRTPGGGPLDLGAGDLASEPLGVPVGASRG